MLAATAIISCDEKNEKVDQSQEISKDKSEELDELSIYNLTSKWNTQHGNTIVLNDLKGKVTVMVMIYTSCQVACPRLVSDMRSIESKVPKELEGKIQYVMVSIDPKTDTPEKMMEFSKENKMTGNQWLFLQGTEETVREFANVLAVKYKEISPIDFSHSNIVSVFNPEGVLVHQQEGLGVDNKETLSAIIKEAKK